MCPKVRKILCPFTNIRALMESMNITYDEAVRLLKIDTNEIEKYRKLLMN